MRTRRAAAYPFLAALYPVLALAAVNSGELVRLSDLVKPLAISLAASVVAWLLSRTVTRDIDGRAFLAFVMVVVFSTGGYGVAFLSRWVTAGLAAFVVSVPLVVAAATLAGRGRVSFHPLTRYLNIVLAILVTWVGASFLSHLRLGKASVRLEDLHHHAVAAADTSAKARPNFFLIILDQYTGHQSLKANYGLDNTPFEQALEGYGFVVPGSARANYVHTFLALAAMLNWQYLDDVADQLGHENQDWAAAYPLIENNRTWHVLRDLGYRFAFMPTALPATDHNRYADLQLPEPRRLTHEFESVWWRGTIILPVLAPVCSIVGCSGGGLPYVPESATSIDWKFATLPSLAESEEPIFVLAHLTIPHEPYVYEADCRHRKPYWPIEAKRSEEDSVTAAYVAQVRCVNRKVEALVKAILDRSRRPPIILLQSDHGYGRPGATRPALSDADAALVRERTDIFEAYLLPGAPPGLVYDSISPINTMRAVMRYYYDVDVPPLADATYWSSNDRPYRFTRVR